MKQLQMITRAMEMFIAIFGTSLNLKEVLQAAFMNIWIVCLWKREIVIYILRLYLIIVAVKIKIMYLASLYMYAVTTIPNLKAITYKYLIKGHTQKAWGKAGKVRDALTGTGRGPSVPPMTEQENNVLMISCRAAMFGFTDQETSFVS